MTQWSFKHYLADAKLLALKGFLIFAFQFFSLGIVAQVHNCNNWLYTPSKTSAVSVGSINIPGNQMTIEATIFQTANNPVFNTGDIVSKHTDPGDCNYLLRPGDGSITTSNGFFKTPAVCTIENNRVYHIAMVYDGASLKFYRNGYLMSQIAASGNLVQNGIITRIGYYAYEYWDEQFFGFINDVRIWNVARSQSEIGAFMNVPLPNPSTQTGLLAYYTFDNLINKQGNATFNGVINGNAVANQSLPDCGFIIDSCKVNINDSLIINHYASVEAYLPCDNELQVDNASDFNAGDTVLIMQMKGATIDSTNSASFGTVTNYGSAGNYEFNIVKSKSGNRLTLANEILGTYDFINGVVQLVRVPYYADVTFSKRLTCQPWNGKTGGVLVLNASGTVTMNANMDVTGKGFRHGAGLQSTKVTSNATGYFYDAASNDGGEKGEGIYTISDLRKYGRGALANGGGAGNAQKAGGGGGANGGAGGDGGDQYEPLKTIVENVGGKGGTALLNSAVLNKLFLGGAGGTGQANDLAEYPAGNGGGIIILSANQIISNSHIIKANGENATEAPSPSDSKDGMPGGGGGGSILLDISNAGANTKIEANGGKGADQISIAFNGRHGPGGGGGGGVIAVSQAVMPTAYVTSISGGINGLNKNYSDDPWGATAGMAGLLIPGFQVAIAMVPFKKNIDSVTLSSTITQCDHVSFAGTPYVNHSPISTWNWNFGDSQSDNIQNPNHQYSNEGSFPVKLVVTDINGCRDSAIKNVVITRVSVQASNDTSICATNAVQLHATGGGTAYQWTPSADLDDPSVANPVASPAASTKYFVTLTGLNGCRATDSVTITVNALPQITKSNDTSVCSGSAIPLVIGGGATYAWRQDPSLSNISIPDPIATPEVSTNYHFVVTSAEGCAKEDSIAIALFPVQKFQISGNSLICLNTATQLSASGGNNFSWWPNNLLNDPSSQNPNTLPLNSTTTFHVQITDQYTCKYEDSVTIWVRPERSFNLTGTPSICKGTSASLTASGGDEYFWYGDSPINNSSDSTVSVAPLSDAVYAVVIRDSVCGKKDTLETSVKVNPLPIVSAMSANDISCTEPTSQLNATSSGTSFVWTPAASLDNNQIANPVANPTTTTIYFVTVTDVNGCVNSDSVTVNVNYTGKSFSGMPNAFTPNGDGLNDCFRWKTYEPVSDFHLSIFNRFGQLVFQTKNVDDCWDGRFMGKPQDAGVFVFIVSGRTPCQEIRMKGTVTLIR